MNIAISVRKNVSKRLVEGKFSTFFNMPWPIFRQINFQSSPGTKNHLWFLKDLDNCSNDVFLGIQLLISGPIIGLTNFQSSPCKLWALIPLELAHFQIGLQPMVFT